MAHQQYNQKSTFSFMQTMWKTFTKKMVSIEMKTQEKLASLEKTYQQVTIAQQEELKLFEQKVYCAHQALEQKKQTNIEYLQKLKDDLNSFAKGEKSLELTMSIEENKIKKISIKGEC